MCVCVYKSGQAFGSQRTTFESGFLLSIAFHRMGPGIDRLSGSAEGTLSFTRWATLPPPPPSAFFPPFGLGLMHPRLVPTSHYYVAQASCLPKSGQLCRFLITILNPQILFPTPDPEPGSPPTGRGQVSPTQVTPLQCSYTANILSGGGGSSPEYTPTKAYSIAECYSSPILIKSFSGAVATN